MTLIPLIYKYSSPNKLLIVHGDGGSPILRICNLDLTGCSTQTLPGVQIGGTQTEVFIDPVYKMLYVFFNDVSSSYTLISYRCDILAGTACKKRNISKQFGNNTNGFSPHVMYHPLLKRIYVATRNEELGSVISVYHFISYIEDP